MSEYEGKYDRRLLARLREVEAERDALREENERLKGDVTEARQWAEKWQKLAHEISNCVGDMSKEVKTTAAAFDEITRIGQEAGGDE